MGYSITSNGALSTVGPGASPYGINGANIYPESMQLVLGRDVNGSDFLWAAWAAHATNGVTVHASRREPAAVGPFPTV
jgi:hypothetical protein